MLYLTLSNCVVHTWHIGETLPDVDINFVNNIQADGDELLYIIRLNVISTTVDIIQTWYGNLAKSLYFNLRLEAEKKKAI